VAARAGVDEATLERAVTRARSILYERRAERVWPARDEKVLAAWNGLMLRAVAEMAHVSGREDYRALALRNGDFLFREMVRDDRVMRSWRDGTAVLAGYLEDYAAVALGALALYELTFDRLWADRAIALARSMVTWFWSDEAGGFYDTPRDHESLVTRPREITDNAIPSGTSLAAELLLRLADLMDDADFRRRATWLLDTLAEPLASYPLAFGHALGVATMAAFGTVEVALAGDPEQAPFDRLAREVASHYVPNLVLAGGAAGAGAPLALLRDRPLQDGQPTAYVCRQYACDAPVTAPDALGLQLERAVRGGTAGAAPGR
jgi:uncharacterized protein YyaL (SSP411 family)